MPYLIKADFRIHLSTYATLYATFGWRATGAQGANGLPGGQRR
ncbi:MAG TPA: hypothetical protein VLH79_09670 [Chthonomonadales bacterium]|nr:hypothetical protein [Chthonomonadales bacterium]